MIFERLPLGHVAQIDQQVERRAPGVLDHGGVVVHPDRGAVPPLPPCFEIQGAGLTPEQALPAGAFRGDIVGVQQPFDRRAQQLGFVQVEQSAEGGRDLEPPAVEPDVRHHHQRKRFGSRQTLLALLQRSFSAPADGVFRLKGPIGFTKLGRPIRNALLKLLLPFTHAVVGGTASRHEHGGDAQCRRSDDSIPPDVPVQRNRPDENRREECQHDGRSAGDQWGVLPWGKEREQDYKDVQDRDIEGRGSPHIEEQDSAGKDAHGQQ